jgi:hypothetical protein
LHNQRSGTGINEKGVAAMKPMQLERWQVERRPADHMINRIYAPIEARPHAHITLFGSEEGLFGKRTVVETVTIPLDSANTNAELVERAKAHSEKYQWTGHPPEKSLPPLQVTPKDKARHAVMDAKFGISFIVGALTVLIGEILYVRSVGGLGSPQLGAGNTVYTSAAFLALAMVGIIVPIVFALIVQRGLTLLLGGAIGGGVVAAHLHTNVLVVAVVCGIVGFVLERLATVALTGLKEAALRRK